MLAVGGECSGPFVFYLPCAKYCTWHLMTQWGIKKNALEFVELTF